MTPEGRKLTSDAEGYSEKVYKDIAGFPTIGRGHRVASMDEPNWSHDRIEAVFDLDYRRAEIGALALVPDLKLEPHRLAALTDLVFNVGARALVGSGLVRRLRARDWAGAAAKFRLWDHARDPGTGKLVEVRALKIRREAGARWIELGG